MQVRLGGSAARRLGGSAARRLGGSADHCNNAFQRRRQGRRRTLHGVTFPDATTKRLANPSRTRTNPAHYRMALAPHRRHGPPPRKSSRPARPREIFAYRAPAGHNIGACALARRSVRPARRIADAGGRADIGRRTLVGIGSGGVRGHGQARCAVRARPARRPRRQRADEPLDGAGGPGLPRLRRALDREPPCRARTRSTGAAGKPSSRTSSSAAGAGRCAHQRRAAWQSTSPPPQPPWGEPDPSGGVRGHAARSSEHDMICAHLEEIAARAGGLGLVLDRVCKRGFHHRLRGVGPLERSPFVTART